MSALSMEAKIKKGTQNLQFGRDTTSVDCSDYSDRLIA